MVLPSGCGFPLTQESVPRLSRLLLQAFPARQCHHQADEALALPMNGKQHRGGAAGCGLATHEAALPIPRARPNFPVGQSERPQGSGAMGRTATSTSESGRASPRAQEPKRNTRTGRPASSASTSRRTCCNSDVAALSAMAWSLAWRPAAKWVLHLSCAPPSGAGPMVAAIDRPGANGCA